jgi:hypothetical protein
MLYIQTGISHPPSISSYTRRATACSLSHLLWQLVCLFVFNSIRAVGIYTDAVHPIPPHYRRRVIRLCLGASMTLDHPLYAIESAYNIIYNTIYSTIFYLALVSLFSYNNCGGRRTWAVSLT